MLDTTIRQRCIAPHRIISPHLTGPAQHTTLFQPAAKTMIIAMPALAWTQYEDSLCQETVMSKGFTKVLIGLKGFQ